MAKVFVVDDEKGMRLSLRRFLETEGHEVASAEDADEALLKIKPGELDVVVTDIIMPKIDGMEFMRRIHEIDPDLKVIVITGEPTVDTASEAFRAGAFDYFSKPFSRADICRAVEKAIRIKRLEAENRSYRERLEEKVKERTAKLEATNEKLLAEIEERKQMERALRESEARFRELAELLPEIVFEMDENGYVTFVNRQALLVSGYAAEDVEKGFQGLNFIAPEDRPRAVKNFKKIISGAPSVIHEYRALRKDGSTFPILARSAPIQKNGRTVGLRGIFIDISNRE